MLPFLEVSAYQRVLALEIRWLPKLEQPEEPLTAAMSHLQWCCVLAAGRMRTMGGTDLSSNLAQLVSCLS